MVQHPFVREKMRVRGSMTELTISFIKLLLIPSCPTAESFNLLTILCISLAVGGSKSQRGENLPMIKSVGDSPNSLKLLAKSKPKS